MIKPPSTTICQEKKGRAYRPAFFVLQLLS